MQIPWDNFKAITRTRRVLRQAVILRPQVRHDDDVKLNKYLETVSKYFDRHGHLYQSEELSSD